MKAQVTYIDQPLKNMSLQGLHLIEASAGTGKTWTLSSLMVRILTEKYMPRQVIATTFTRAAAAELQSRIRLRLQDMQRQTILWMAIDPSQYASFKSELKDPLEQILFEKFECVNGVYDRFDYLNKRLLLVIDSLDELFVGTIDSFTQKLLREFSFESGEVIPRQLTDKEQQYPYQIVHDVLRAWLMQQSQPLIDLLLLSQSLQSIDSYVETVSKTLNFSQAKLQQVDFPQLDLEAVNQHLMHIITLLQQDPELKSLAAYFDLKGDYYAYIDKRAFAKDKFNHLFTQKIPAIFSLLATNQNLLLTPLFKAKLVDLGTIFFDSKGNSRESVFGTKCPSDVAQAFYQHPFIASLSQLLILLDKQKAQLNRVDDYLRYYLSVEVKKRLPHTLLEEGETTFNQQTRTLREALQGEKGQRFAKAVVQRYPIILVDEFQDTSQEQDNILKTIWRDKANLQQSCFIAVGDPKQAIYGFRGGDILTYINAFNDIATKRGYFYRLMYNFRSVERLVNVVDHIFMRQTDFGENIDYYQAKSGNDQLKPLLYKGQPDLQPLKKIQLTKDANEEYIIAHKVRALLVLGQKGELSYSQAGQNKPIQPEDIAILATSQRELDLVQKQLEKIKIQVNRATLTSVFTSQSAQDVGAILQAIVDPENEPKLKRALITPAIGLKLQDFIDFEEHAEELSHHIHRFRHIRQLWVNRGFLMAWQSLTDQYQIWQNLAAHQGEYAERTIVNTRHLIELLSQHSYQYPGIQHLLHWYQMQLSSPQQRDWELERKLSSAAGVQLMTIHKSKGLEFKIVFLMSANKLINPSKAKSAELGFFEQGEGQAERVIAVGPHLIKEDEQAYHKHLEKKLAEDHRLWYVALTRASYAMYLMLHENKPKAGEQYGGVGFWLSHGEEFSHDGFTVEESALLYDDYSPKPLSALNLQAIQYPQQVFYPKNRTSFSYLTTHRYQKKHMDALAEYSPTEQGADDEPNQSDEVLYLIADNSSENQPLTWIQQNFPKGAKAGNCLHDLLEDIDFQNKQNWEKEIYRKLSLNGMWPLLLQQYQDTIAPVVEVEAAKKQIKDQMMGWLEYITETPIHIKSKINTTWLSLKDIQIEHRIAEFEFYLALADQRFVTQNLHQLFQMYDLNMPDFELAHSARYLNGAIDLVYFDGEKFHIADYKSNYLGADLQQYSEQNIAQSMTESSYWLQAGLYLVALHRYLKTSFEGYDPQVHLGGASYLYLRGMQGKQGVGVYHWEAPLALILALDDRLGQRINQGVS